MSDIPGIGSLEPLRAQDNLELLAPVVAQAVQHLLAEHPDFADQILVTQIDPKLADTEAMTNAFGMDLALSANCILVAGKRAGQERISANLVRANTNLDVNHVVKKRLDVRKASFWPMEQAVAASHMEYGGITPIGIPADWRLFIDTRCIQGWSCIGSGLRSSKLFVTGKVLSALPGVEVVEGLAN